jgi:hypothetical protein
MPTLIEIKETLQNHKHRLSEKYGINRMAIFGSYSVGQQTIASDIDILVDFNKPIGIEFIDLADELESMLHLKVDLISKNGVKSHYLKQIESQLQYV